MFIAVKPRKILATLLKIHRHMMYDYTAGGMVKTAYSEKKTFLVDPQIIFDSAYFSARDSSKKQKTSPEVARSEVLARWRKDEGAIGRVVRRGEIDRLRAALESVRRQK